MKPILIGSTGGADVESEREARFGKKAGGLTINCAIMTNFKPDEVQKKLATARAQKQVALLWVHPEHSTINTPGFHPDLIPVHPDVDALINLLREHSSLGGIAFCDVMDEMEQYQKWGGAVYRKNFDAIAERFPQGCFACWSKGPNPAKIPLTFADWRPSLASYRGVHPFADCVDPASARGFDMLRFLHDPATAGLPTAILSGGMSAGDILDPVQARTWVKRLLGIVLAPEYDVRICNAPENQDYAGFPGIGGGNGRYCPGAHQPPGDKTSPPWPGSPEFCAVLDKAFGVAGQWMGAGDKMLDAVFGGVAVKP